MLVLTRKVGEKIVLPNVGVEIHVNGIRGDKVSIGIEAPSDVAIHREEVWHRMRPALAVGHDAELGGDAGAA